jgi:transcriptional regulator with XRE-family HTH domain
MTGFGFGEHYRMLSSSRARIALTACQVRMARAALRWSIEELSRHSGVSEKTIRRIEKVYGVPPNVTLETLEKLRICFEAEGMTLIPEDGGPDGPGVRYGRYPGRVIATIIDRPARLLAEEERNASGSAHLTTS